MPASSTELLVIGGGATGLGVAWDACLRGIKVVLVEQSDLGQGTSGRYHGLLHSGGRYVLSDPPSARDCARENEILRRLAPSTIEDTGGLFISTPTDPADFPDRWLIACREAGVPAEEVTLPQVLQAEPLLNPALTRAFRVRDGSLDSFDLLHLLAESIRSSGGQVWLRHKVDRILTHRGAVVGAEVIDLKTRERRRVGAQVVVNAAGPWARDVASMARVDLPIALGRGAMVAMASRLVNTVVNRCKPPSDGDILVPVGTVCILGTTDEAVQSPDDMTIAPWEIDLLLAEAEVLVPGIATHRALRAWSGIRPLYRPTPASGAETRVLPRAHTILDHAATQGVSGMVSVIGGKLTTFRLMAEEVMRVVAPSLGARPDCATASTPLEPAGRPYHRLPHRLEQMEHPPSAPPPSVVCECELVTRPTLESALQSIETPDLDDLRRDLRLGMGPCQAAFCGYRAAGLTLRTLPSAPPDGGLGDFLQERWRGLRPLAWGQTIRQLEFSRRIMAELLGLPAQGEDK
jgi:glycerol-3-phosphate dehydrogenase